MSRSLWTNMEIEGATKAHTDGRKWSAAGVSIDSRKVQPKDIFIAFRGSRVDGHCYVADAFEKGAAAAIVERKIDGLSEESPVLIVANVQKALVQIACLARKRSEAKFVAVTGSVGKTSSKNLLAKALAQFDSVHATIGNLNNHIGAPLSLARLNGSSRFAVFELGMNNTGEIAFLSNLIRPKVALITNVHGVHLEQLKTERAIAEAKAEIFNGLSENGSVVLNQDNPWIDFLKSRAEKKGIKNIITFGEDKKSDLQLLEWQPGEGKSFVKIQLKNETHQYVLSETGKHRALNSVGVLAVVHALGLDIQHAAKCFKSISTPVGRGGQKHINLTTEETFCLVDESYNASPVAMKSAFSVLKSMKPGPGGRKIIVIGDMLELGDDALKLHVELLDDLLAAKPDIVFTVGRLMFELHKLLPTGVFGAHGAKSIDVADQIANLIKAGDLVLVKGSLGTNMAPIIAAINSKGLENTNCSESNGGNE